MKLTLRCVGKISVSFGRLYSCINQDETKENLNEAKQTEESKSLLIFYGGGGGD